MFCFSIVANKLTTKTFPTTISCSMITHLNLNFFVSETGASFHQNRRTGPRHPVERDRERERERERVERERERLHARERELATQYDLQDDDIINERNYSAASDYNSRGHLNAMPATTHIRHTQDDDDMMRDRDNDRYPMATQSHIPGRRERVERDRPDEYSPHRGGRSNRRVLNAM